MKRTPVSITLLCVGVVLCSDFYMGMFNKNDYLVAQDRLYKDRIPYRMQIAKYGRMFKCPITYVRVVDRLGYGGGPITKIIRGGLKKKYVVLRISAYNKPISVNIYVGCQNKRKFVKTKATTPAITTTNTTVAASASEASGNATDDNKSDIETTTVV